MAATFVTLKASGRLDRVNFRNDFWDWYQGQISPVAIPETIARQISAPDLFSFQKWRMYSLRLALTLGFNPGNEVGLAPCFGLVLLKPHTNGRNIVGYHMLRPFAHLPCCMLLEVVAQSLKRVKRLSTCKRTQQLPKCWANNIGSLCVRLHVA